MDPKQAFLELSRITDVILVDEINYGKLQKALQDYRNLLVDISPLNFEDEHARRDIFLKHGKAIAPEWASLCIEDLLRTRNFVRAIYKAVLFKRKNKILEPVHVLYVGTGPFATLVLPLISKFSSEELKFSFVEINPDSLNSVKYIFNYLNALHYVENIIQGDATHLKLENPGSIDITVVECLLHALSKEPQVAITLNLLPQLSKNSIFIPENIKLGIGLFKPKNFDEQSNYSYEPDPLYFKEIFSLDRKLVETYVDIELDDIVFPTNSFQFDEKLEGQNLNLSITTTIKLFEDEEIKWGESGLTIPQTIDFLGPSNWRKGVTTKYQLGNHPGLKFNFVN